MGKQVVTFTGEAADLLNELAQKRGVSVSEVLRTAINRESWFEEATENGGMLYYKKDGEEDPQPVEFVDQ